jgi:amino acid adenylation domain-containing protein
MQPETLNGFRLSPQQRRLWLLQIANTVFRAQCAVVLTGFLDRAALKTTFEQLIRRHEILRTTFSQMPGMKFPIQVVNEQSAVSWTEHDLMELNEVERVTRTEELWVDELRRPFNFERGPLLHLTLAALGSRQHLLLVTLPSLCADSWTLKTLVQEAAAAYHSSDVVEDRLLQYAQVAEWQNELLNSNDFEGLGQQPAHLPEEWVPPRLPYEINVSGIDDFAPERVEIPVRREDHAKLLALAEQYRLPADDFMLALWHTLIWRLTDGNDVLVGRVLVGRDHETLLETFGPISNCLPTVVNFTPSLPFSSVVRALAAARNMLEDQVFFDIDRYQPVRNSAGTDHAARFFPFVYSSQDWPTEFQAADLSFTIRDSYVCSEAFAIMLNSNRSPDSWRAEFFYDSRRLRRADVCYLARLFGTQLTSAMTNPETSVSQLELLTDSERQQLILTSGEVEPQEKCLHELFEERVGMSPEGLAVVCGEEEMSYRELNERANQVARYLWRNGVRAEGRVGILLERSAAQVWGLLGVLKAGAAYVPLDVMSPEARVREQLRDGGVELVLTEQRWAKQVASAGVKVICVDGAEGVELQEERKERLAVPVTAENLAYVIYTSGSTGQPKGVMVSHRSVGNLATALRSSIYHGLGKPLRVSLNAPFTFDASVKQWIQLLEGHVLHILKEEVRYDPSALLSYVRQHQIQILDCTPAQLRSLLAAGLLEEHETSLLAVLCGGDQLDHKTWADLTSSSTTTRSYNLYGPTECTVDTTIGLIQPQQSRPTLGWPVTNVQLHLLDHYLNHVPLGVAGEIFVGGEGVSRGYLGRAALTAERFVPDPFSPRSGARLYMTGDMARYVEGGLEFVGRKDHQVKIKGFRIELEEIEVVLKAHEAVRDVVVIADDDASQEKQLVAYVAVSGDQAQSASEFDLEGNLRGFLRERLPAHMIPSTFVLLNALPLSRHGKVDRAALPPPDQRPPVPKDFLPPRNASERAIAAIWREVLGLDRIGIHDNFFDLGGQSLLMAQAYTRLKDTLGREYSMIDMFRYPTVSSLAAFLSNEAGPDEFVTRSKIEKRVDKQQSALEKQRQMANARKTHE